MSESSETHILGILGVQVSTHPSEKKVILSVQLSQDPKVDVVATLDRAAVDALRDLLEFHMHLAEETR